MQPLHIHQTTISPEVYFNPASGLFTIEGKSMPEDVAAFYIPLIEWFEKYAEAPAGETNLELKISYLNTASSKYLLDMLFKLQHVHDEHGGVSVNWYFQEEDESMEEAGEAYASILHIPFELIMVEDVWPALLLPARNCSF